MVNQRDIRAALRRGRLPVGRPIEWRPFELASAFSDGLATAYHRYFSSGSWHTLVDPSTTFEIVDPFDPPVYEGRYRNQHPWPYQRGSMGIVRRASDSLQWEVMTLTPAAKYLGGDLVIGTGGLQIANPQVLGTVGGILIENPAGPIDVQDDLFGWEPDQSGKAVAIRQDGVWQLLLVVPIPEDKVGP